MKDKVILKTDLKGFKILQANIRFYKALGVDFVEISPFEKLDESEIAEILSLNDFYQKNGLGLILSFDIKLLMARLLGEKPSAIDFSDPKIRQGLYGFISYLIKYGVRSFKLEGLPSLAKGGKSLIERVRELNKNTFFNKEVFSLAEINEDKNTLTALANPNFSCLAMVKSPKEIGDIFEFARDFTVGNSNLALSFDNFPKSEINFENYPLYARRMIYMSLFFLKSSLYIDESDLDFEDIKFLRKLFALKNQVQNLPKITKILPKEKEILAFVRSGGGKKILFLANLSEKEVLVDLSYKVLDYKKYEFLLGSITERRLFRTILLRPYEAVSFINCK